MQLNREIYVSISVPFRIREIAETSADVSRCPYCFKDSSPPAPTSFSYIVYGDVSLFKLPHASLSNQERLACYIASSCEEEVVHPCFDGAFFCYPRMYNYLFRLSDSCFCPPARCVPRV
jgi:hypothetical protein